MFSTARAARAFSPEGVPDRRRYHPRHDKSRRTLRRRAGGPVADTQAHTPGSISVRPRERRVVAAVRSRLLLALHLSIAHPNGLLRLSARRTILPRPKHTEAELLGSTRSQAAKIATGGWADP